MHSLHCTQTTALCVIGYRRLLCGSVQTRHPNLPGLLYSVQRTYTCCAGFSVTNGFAKEYGVAMSRARRSSVQTLSACSCRMYSRSHCRPILPQTDLQAYSVIYTVTTVTWPSRGKARDASGKSPVILPECSSGDRYVHMHVCDRSLRHVGAPMSLRWSRQTDSGQNHACCFGTSPHGYPSQTRRPTLGLQVAP